MEAVSGPHDIPKSSPKSVYRLTGKVVTDRITNALEPTLLLVRYPGAEEARITTNSARPLRVRHRRRGVQRIHFSVGHSGHPILPRSEFSPRHRYPGVRKLELEQLVGALLSADPSAVRHVLKDKIKAYGRGELPYARAILPALYERMESIQSFKARTESIKPLKANKSQSPSPSNRGTTTGDWKELKDALTRSLISGTFLDS